MLKYMNNKNNCDNKKMTYFSELPEEINQAIFKNVFDNTLKDIKSFDKHNLRHTPFLHINDIFSSNIWNWKNNSDYVRRKYLEQKYKESDKKKIKENDLLKLLCDLERPVVWADKGWFVRKWKCSGNWDGEGYKIKGGINWGRTSIYEPGKLSEYRYKMLTKDIPVNRYGEWINNSIAVQ